jgi:LysM repeat protein
MTGMVVAPATGGGAPALLWTESGNLMSASLGPTVVETPSPVVAGPSVFTYMVMTNDSLALIASKFGWTERELRLANPDLDLDHLTVGMEISIPGRFTVSPTPGPPDPGLGG